MSDLNAVPEFDEPSLPTPEEISLAVYTLNDWSGGQYYILSKPRELHARYFRTLYRKVVVAWNYGDQLLDDNGREVAERLLAELPGVIRASEYGEWTPKEPNLAPLPKPEGARAGYVYLLRSPTTAYKIGRTKDPYNRVRTFGVQLPFEVEYVCLIPADDMYVLESSLHNRFASRRANGEWFLLTPEDVEYIKGLAS